MGVVLGVVASFDDPRGYGTVRTDEGRDLFFHCTRIAGGTRTIVEGTRVAAEVAPGHLGRWEAATVTPLPPA
jgi:cold shock CspA family protein